MQPLARLNVVGRRCTYWQAILALVVTAFAAYLAVATNDDIHQIGTPSVEGVTVAGASAFAASAAAVATALWFAARRAYAGSFSARAVVGVSEIAISIWLVRVAPLWLDEWFSGVLWTVAAVITLCAAFSLALTAERAGR